MIISIDDRGFAHTVTYTPSEVTTDGVRRWHKHGVLHRSCNRPAVIYPDGRAEWWLEGRFLHSGRVKRIFTKQINNTPSQPAQIEKPLTGSLIKQTMLDLHKRAIDVIVPRTINNRMRETWFKIYRLLRLEGLGASEAEAAAHAYIEKPKPRGTWQAHCRHYLKQE